MAEHLQARFYDHATLNVSESEIKGTKIFDDVVMIELTVRGARESISYVATEEHKAEYPEAWALYSGERFTGNHGTPLNVLGEGFTMARVKEFEAMHIRSVEQLALVSDANIMRLREGLKAKHLAVTYLEGQKLAQQNVSMDQFHDMRRMIEELKEQNEQLALNQRLKPGRKVRDGEDAQAVM